MLWYPPTAPLDTEKPRIVINTVIDEYIQMKIVDDESSLVATHTKQTTIV